MGSVVDCPRCHKPVVVPPHSAPQAEQLYQILKNKRTEGTTDPTAEIHSVSEPTVPESAWDELGGNVNDADLNQWIDELLTTTTDNKQESFSLLLQTPVSTPEAAEKIALHDLQKKHKLTLTLLCVSTTVAFFIGIVFGIFIRGLSVQPVRSVPMAGEAAEVNEITGTLYYLNENGERRADVEAVIICLPKDRFPSPPLSCQGLCPEDAVNNDTVQLIHELGGLYARADVNGTFVLQYQKDVRYFIILISAHQIQPEGILPPSVLQNLRRYFRDPERFGNNCLNTDEYEWDKPSLRYTFESAD
jgi:hypothetical protein